MAGPLYRQLVRMPYDIEKSATANAILRQAGLSKAF